MLHDHDRRFQGRGKLGEDLRQRERPSGRRAEQNQGVQGRLLDRPLDRREDGKAAVCGGVLPISLPITSILRSNEAAPATSPPKPSTGVSTASRAPLPIAW